MGIFSRLTDIVNSNIVSMLDKAENPEKMVRLMIQEMEDTLVEVKSLTAKVIADKKRLQRDLSLVQMEITKWQEKAELAVSKERDDLAVLALEEKAKKEAIEDEIKHDLLQVEDSLEKHREDIVTLEDKLKDAKKKQRAIIMRQQTAKSQLDVRKKLKRADSAKAFAKFEQFERRIDQMEGEVEAHDIKSTSLDDEFAKLENESKVNEQLQALKEKMKKDQQ